MCNIAIDVNDVLDEEPVEVGGDQNNHAPAHVQHFGLNVLENIARNMC